MKRIYLDYAATTPIDSKVSKSLCPYMVKMFGNTSSLHSFGQETAAALEKSRSTIANSLNVKPNEMIFTASATESNNFALKGVANAYKDKGNHIIISNIEHDCVKETANFLKKEGLEITEVKVNQEGLINPEDVKAAIKDNTILVSIMHANNEIGTIQPIEEIAAICKNHKVLFHTDAAQSFGKIPINTENIDLLTASSHKMYGPKGSALLMIKQGTRITPLLHGGGHEFNKRSSTVNLAAIVGFARAVELCMAELELGAESKRQVELRNKIISTILKEIPDSTLNGSKDKRLPNNINIRFKNIEGESIIMMLDEEEIACSTGSACSSPKLTPSHVLTALGISAADAHGSLRVSLGRQTTEEEVNTLLETLPKIIKRLREISPLK